MKITPKEQAAIRQVLALGAMIGYGNAISHLKTAWAKSMVRNHGLTEDAARESVVTAGGDGYPFLMQDDLVERGEWDHTGERYGGKGPKGVVVAINDGKRKTE